MQHCEFITFQVSNEEVPQTYKNYHLVLAGMADIILRNTLQNSALMYSLIDTATNKRLHAEPIDK